MLCVLLPFRFFLLFRDSSGFLNFFSFLDISKERNCTFIPQCSENVPTWYDISNSAIVNVISIHRNLCISEWVREAASFLSGLPSSTSQYTFERCEMPALCFVLVVAGVDLVHVFMKLTVQRMRPDESSGIDLCPYDGTGVFHREADV